MAMVICPECKTEISDKAASCPKCGAVRAPKKKTSPLTWLVTIIAGDWLVGYLSVQNHEARVAAGTEPPSPKEAALKQLEFHFSWERGGFDTILELDGKLYNGSEHDIRDFKINCYGYGKSGTKIDTNSQTFYEVVKKGETKSFQKMNMGFLNSQVDSVRCGIADFVVM